jgi:hypothetical protein
MVYKLHTVKTTCYEMPHNALDFERIIWVVVAETAAQKT